MVRPDDALLRPRPGSGLRRTMKTMPPTRLCRRLTTKESGPGSSHRSFLPAKNQRFFPPDDGAWLMTGVWRLSASLGAGARRGFFRAPILCNYLPRVRGRPRLVFCECAGDGRDQGKQAGPRAANPRPTPHPGRAWGPPMFPH